MYTITVKEDNTLFPCNPERIMQRSKLVDKLCFLVPPEYKGIDTTNYTLLMEYMLPISKKYESDILEFSGEYHEEYLKYVIPFDTKLTAEHGDIEVQISFLNVDLNTDGSSYQLVRKTSPCKVTIVPIAAWSDIIPDNALSAVDQRIIAVTAQMKALNDMATSLNENKADDVKYDKNSHELQLMSGDKEIGSKVIIECNGNGSGGLVDPSVIDKQIQNGIPVVEFGIEPTLPDDEKDDSTEKDDDIVVEF